MTDHLEQIRAAFRLNLEQQKKRAKDLLKAAKAGDAAARSRIAAANRDRTKPSVASGLKLADAQFAVARELGIASWRELKIHISSMDRARGLLDSARHLLDTDMKTLHLRCGSDIKPTLLAAGFSGGFLEVSYPYCYGPVTTAADHLEQEARFIAEFAGKQMNVAFADALARRHQEENELRASAASHPRIVLWMEHDCFDQFVLLRCLAHYASTQRPDVLELIVANQFPGAIRFVGLGHLPPEALRLLWEQRNPVTREQLDLAAHAWRALALPDPRTLAAIMRTGTPALPDLAPAMHRLLRELPSVQDGLGLTDRLILQLLATQSRSIHQLFDTLTWHVDPLPFATDLLLLHFIDRMERLSDPVVIRASSTEGVWQDTLTISDMGAKVLRGEVDFMSLQPAARWVGGVRVGGGGKTWRWDTRTRDAVLKE